MDTAEIMILAGAGACAAALALLTYLLGTWRGEHRAAREYVDLLAERHALAVQRAALEEQRAALGRQRVYLEQIEERRRTPRRMPDSGRAPVVDDDPTREIDVSTFGRLAPMYLADHPHKRHHRREEQTMQHGPRPAPYPNPNPND
jgi:hypothetical protein